MNTFTEYEDAAAALSLNLDKYTVDGLPIYYCLGVAGESGELVDKVKKAWRNNSQINIYETLKEVGDVLWYLTMIARFFNSSLQEVAELNINKLRDRATRLVIVGEGDNR